MNNHIDNNVDNNSVEDNIVDDNTVEAVNETDRKRKTRVSDVIRRVIMIVCLCVFLYSGYMLVTIFLNYKQGDDVYKTIEDSVLTPSQSTYTINNGKGDEIIEVPFVYNHEKLLSINPDGVGYLYIPSIDIRLPIVQGDDNDYYLTHTFNNTTNSAGALFVDYRIEEGLAASHVIIYGHNMKNGSMFGKLSNYSGSKFYNQTGNDKFYIYTENKIMEYKIFTAYTTDVENSTTYQIGFGDLSSLRQYAKDKKSWSYYDTGVDVSDAKQIVTFSTCTGDDAERWIVSGIYVGESALD